MSVDFTLPELPSFAQTFSPATLAKAFTAIYANKVTAPGWDVKDQDDTVVWRVRSLQDDAVTYLVRTSVDDAEDPHDPLPPTSCTCPNGNVNKTVAHCYHAAAVLIEKGWSK